MSPAFQSLCDHFEQNELKHHTNAEQQIILATFSGKAGVYHLAATAGRGDELCQVFGAVPFQVPDGCRPAICETLAYINFGLKLGKFELNPNDGELRFQVASIVGEQVDDETIERLVGGTICMLDRYMPAVLSVMYGNESPADAVRLAEAVPF